jgi:ATP-dependent Clp protease adaptor protein ClpS
MTILRRFLLVLLCLIAGSNVAVAFSTSTQSKVTAAWGMTSSSLRLHRDSVVMMPAIIEREAVKIGGPAVLERPVTERREKVDEPTKQRKGLGSEAWEVRIYNDGLNTREHVARSLVQVTGMSETGAYQTMMQAHQNGIAVVGRWVYEVAEMYHDALRTNGIVCDIVPVDEE